MNLRLFLTIKRAAIALGVAPSTIHRLINDRIIAGEQITPGAPELAVGGTRNSRRNVVFGGSQ
jgi:hypothetical protein